MCEYYSNGDCIDGERVHIKFKKIQYRPNTYIESPTGFKGTKYKCSRDGFTEISVGLVAKDASEAAKLKPTVHLNVGDRLKCKQAYFIANTPKKLKFDVSMMSGRHECSEATPDVRVYAEIETPFDSIAKAAEKKLIALKEQQKQLESSAPKLLLK